jgi:hypothetical protein
LGSCPSRSVSCECPPDIRSYLTSGHPVLRHSVAAAILLRRSKLLTHTILGIRPSGMPSACPILLQALCPDNFVSNLLRFSSCQL